MSGFAEINPTKLHIKTLKGKKSFAEATGIHQPEVAHTFGSSADPADSALSRPGGRGTWRCLPPDSCLGVRPHGLKRTVTGDQAEAQQVRSPESQRPWPGPQQAGGGPRSASAWSMGRRPLRTRGQLPDDAGVTKTPRSPTAGHTCHHVAFERASHPRLCCLSEGEAHEHRRAEGGQDSHGARVTAPQLEPKSAVGLCWPSPGTPGRRFKVEDEQADEPLSRMEEARGAAGAAGGAASLHPGRAGAPRGVQGLLRNQRPSPCSQSTDLCLTEKNPGHGSCDLRASTRASGHK